MLINPPQASPPPPHQIFKQTEFVESAIRWGGGWPSQFCLRNQLAIDQIGSNTYEVSQELKLSSSAPPPFKCWPMRAALQGRG